MAVNGQRNGQERPQDASSHRDSNDSSTADRLQSLENEYKQLTTLFHDLLASQKCGDQQKHSFSGNEAASLPACEITYVSSAEWRAIEFHTMPRNEYSLLTVAPKGFGESASWYQTSEDRYITAKTPPQTFAEPAKETQFSSKKVYRMILNGRAEFMEVLGGIFNSQTLPGFYIWKWPFKQLIHYGDTIRARLVEEESKFEDVEGHPSLSSPRSVNNPGISSNGHLSQLGQGQRMEHAILDPQNTISRHSSSSIQGSGASQDGNENEEDIGPPYSEAESESVAGDRIIKNSMHEPVGAENELKMSQDRLAMRFAQNELYHTGEGTQIDNRTRLRDELRCLVKFMDVHMKEIDSIQKSIDDGTRTTIAFDYLSQLFKPGYLIMKKGEQKRAYIVLHTTGGRAVPRDAQNANADSNRRYGSPQELQEKEEYLAKYAKTSPFVLDCFYLDFDGTNFGPLPEKVMLQDYDGEVPVNSLEAFPLRFDDSPIQTEKILIKRGKRFVKLARVDHKNYSGETIREPIILENPSEVNGEIMIDSGLAIKNFRKKNKEERQNSFDRWDVPRWDFKFGTGVIAAPTPADEREMGDYEEIISKDSPQYKPTYFMEDSSYDNDLRADFIDRTTLLKQRPYSNENQSLSKEMLMLLPPRVYGFSLLDREWCAFDISKVHDLKDTDQGFHNLVLPDEHKKIMQALVQHHAKKPASAHGARGRMDPDFSMDVIRGKGKGLIILLHGVPGVGKTSTAECVAAQTGRPLLPITCGDIGIHLNDVEETLSEYFGMAHKWGSVLLLDEADVFLAKREKGGDLQRNGIVSVFLRVLEYYSGILILTTNRIGEFDEAFSSRVHIKLYYPKLNKKSTLEIWKMNLKRIADSDLDIDVKENEIKKFARKLWADTEDKQTQRWNGRQIRNAFQSAIALAKWDYHENASGSSQRPCLSVQQFEVVAKTSAHFDAYISTMHGIDEVSDAWETIAQREHLRRNETPRKPTSRSAVAAGVMGGRRNAVIKEDTPDEDDGEEETDSDENEERVKKLRAELDRRQKKSAPPVKRSRDTQAGQSQRPTPETKVDDGDSSTSSDEED